MIVHFTEARADFGARMTNIIKRYWKYGSRGGNIEVKLKKLVSDSLTTAYYEGAKAAGFDPKNFNDEMSQQVDDLIFEQFNYLTKFIADIKDAKENKDLQAKTLDRVKWWKQTILSAKFQGDAYANQNKVVTWHLGTTVEHCNTCVELDGQSHPIKWFVERNYIPGKPGAAMDCQGFQCDCKWT